MPLFKHLLKRIVLVVVGYLVSVLAGLVAVVVIYASLSSLPNAPDYFSVMSLSPIVILAVPPLGLFIYWLALVLTAVQTLILALFSEFFRLRGIVVHMLFGLMVAVSAYMAASPMTVDGIGATDWADVGIIGASGLVGGVFYWLIAGRGSGFRLEPLPFEPYPVL